MSSHRSETVGELVVVDVDPTRQRINQAIAGFLAGYSGATLEAYRLDLRQWVCWLDTAGVGVLSVERAHIELYARWCESEGKASATIGRRLSTICGFYNYCSQERLVDRNPAAHVRRRSRTSPAPWASTATNSARSSSRPDCLADGTTRWRDCWR